MNPLFQLASVLLQSTPPGRALPYGQCRLIADMRSHPQGFRAWILSPKKPTINHCLRVFSSNPWIPTSSFDHITSFLDGLYTGAEIQGKGRILAMIGIEHLEGEWGATQREGLHIIRCSSICSTLATVSVFKFHSNMNV